MLSYYHDEMLFSEIYLEEITQEVETADLLAALKVITEYRDFADKSTLKGWKDSYVHEVLSALGFYAKPKSESLTELFPMGSASDDKPLSLCYVVLPDESLDNTLIGRNWAEKIIRALRENDLQWGILTNGRLWRIYHQDEPTPYETYLEIDLEAIITDKAKDAYQIFRKFMKAENFTVNEEGKCRFDLFKRDSQDKIDYIEKELAKALKQREEGGKGVLSDLCMGYVQELRQRAETNLDDEEQRKTIYHSAMLYMFRLLFLFYADARGLLSDDNHTLLEKIETECRARYEGVGSGTDSFGIWGNLEDIFVDIDQTYNGGLFSPQESKFTEFLSDTRIADTYLVNVIYNLSTYQEKNKQVKPISYRDMNVRHLGTLYEGLLEHKLFIAQEDTEVKLSKGKIKFIPASQGGKLKVGSYIRAGEVYFAGDMSERKATGSYYTPEYIVDYIVRNTVGEKLKEIKATFLKEQQATIRAIATAMNEEEHRKLSELFEDKLMAFVREKVLNLSVLDPAMGSGHFLVNAANLISTFITEFLNEVSIQGNQESGTGYWRRWVVENCIYGVDLNPLAVELAKLSIWILSMAKDQPLSFLNHHLKHGNSLVGVRLEEIGNYPLSTPKMEAQQLQLFDQDPDFQEMVERIIDKFRQIAGKTSSNIHDTHEKKAWLEEIEQNLSGYKAICDIHTGVSLGNFLGKTDYSRIVESKDFITAKQISLRNQYFHWKLEFPEVFYNKKGFSCIIGNPPYVVVSDSENYPKSLLLRDTKNLFSFFIGKSSSLVVTEGLVSFIIPLSAFSSSQMTQLHEHFVDAYCSLDCVHFSWRPAKIFDDVNIPVSVFVAKKKGVRDSSFIYKSTNTIRWRSGQNPLKLMRKVNSTEHFSFVTGSLPRFGSEIELSIIKKLRKNQIIGDCVRSPKKDEHQIFFRSSGGLYYKIVTDFSCGSVKEVAITTGNISNNKALLATLSSGLFFWFYDSFGNTRDLSISLIKAFPFDVLGLREDNLRKLTQLSDKLMVDYKVNAETKVRQYTGRPKLSLTTFFARKSKSIIDEIDLILGDHYGFTTEESQFVINYIGEYRSNNLQDDIDIS